MTADGFLSLAINLSFAMVMVAVLFGFIRLVIGPSLADRVVALDMMTVSIVVFCALYAIESGSPVFLDVAIALALVGFLATVSLARYAERGLKRHHSGPDPFLSSNDTPEEPAASSESKDRT
ncbi:monovalent cation/H+ antiporter complex subunit F [Pseudoruegeria sp. SK021]|uniref:monovalent cation/H+ antiporter complex subunit F n=1 Tax=Pseudoruegeria sp. SK021 TaxID=1933035 RepID=UPI000A25C1D1|nr:cation:proton antiporter [Pseudoruegeria sp. SK021]OSP56826.1 hypothetical protein BV911_02490 [Pseudoruegeria sp. SK021]